jgi:hypothetical protein
MTNIDEADTERPKRWDFSWNRWPNRLVYCLLAGWVVSLATGGRFSGINALGLVIVVVLFVLTTVIAEVRRR